MPESSLKYHWFYRYKLYHLPFWAFYHFFWWSMMAGGPLEAIDNIMYPPHTVKYLFYVVMQAISVYVCLYYLIPKYLEKGRYSLFLFSIIGLIIVTALAIMSGYYLSASIFNVDFYELFKEKPEEWYNVVKNHSIPSTIGAMTLGMSIKLAKNWVESKQKQQALEKEKLETELKFLKSQFNPHFLFNTINSIFVLIDKNPAMASESLAKFSGLLRYQLYECNEAQIALDRELSYLNSFVELEKLRQNNNVKVNVNLPNSETGNLKIAPFILMPFIENAFKHVSKQSTQISYIDIEVGLQDQDLIFEIKNTFSEINSSSSELISYGGLGLKNVQRRLNLIYPDSYTLDIKKTKHTFSVYLSISLKKINTYSQESLSQPVL